MNNYKYEQSKKKKILDLISNTEIKYRNIKYLSILALLLIILIIPLSFICFKDNDFGYDFGYDLYGESDNFTISDSSFLLMKNKYYLNYGNLEIKNKEIKITDVKLMANDRLIIRTNEFLQSPSQENKGYGELFPNEVIDNLNNWYYEITYILDDKENKEIINLENRKWNIDLTVDPI